MDDGYPRTSTTNLSAHDRLLRGIGAGDSMTPVQAKSVHKECTAPEDNAPSETKKSSF